MEVFNPKGVKKAEIIVGVPSYNEVRTIGSVTEQVSEGLTKYFPDKKSVIINVDNYSPDGTREAFLKTKSKIPLIYASSSPGEKGKGLNFYNLFSLFRELEGKAGLVVDADLRNIRPTWVKKMIEPIQSGYGYIAPFYSRKKDDATITNNIVFPLFYGLLGSDIRQPIGGEFSFSGRMVDIWLEKKWAENTYQFGIDVFMSLNAILSGEKIGQINLGKKVHKSSTPNLGPMFIQVVETLFEGLKDNLDRIREVREIKETPILNSKKALWLRNLIPDYSHFDRLFIDEFDLNKDWFKKCLSPGNFKKLEQMEKKGRPYINSKMWIEIMYDFLYCYDPEKNAKLVEALRCLYFGRVASYFREVADLLPDEAEKRVIAQAKDFFKRRDYFLDKF
jgi:glucosylglycerate synthase